MAIKLIVTEAFGDYTKGQEITDSKTVQAILEGENAAHVVQVQAPEASASSKPAK